MLSPNVAGAATTKSAHKHTPTPIGKVWAPISVPTLQRRGPRTLGSLKCTVEMKEAHPYRLLWNFPPGFARVRVYN